MIQICLVAGSADANPMCVERTWPQLVELLMEPPSQSNYSLHELQDADPETKRREKDGHGWMPVSLIDPAGRREKSNIDHICALVLDSDSGLGLDAFKERLAAYEFFAHTTFSHSLELPKWRVVLPFKNSIPAADIGSVFDQVNAWFGGAMDTSCGHDPARLYYLPRCPRGAEIEYHHNPGEWLDAEAALHEGTRAGASLRSSSSLPARTAPAGRLPVAEGRRHSALTSFAGTLFRNGKDEAATLDKCLAWNANNTPPLTEKEVRETVRDIARRERRAIAAGEAEWAEVVGRLNSNLVWINKYAQAWSITDERFLKPEQIRNNALNTEVQIQTKAGARLVSHGDAWLRSPDRRTYQDLVFRPGAQEVVDGCLNLWRGWPITPLPGDVTLWTNLLNYVFNGEREHIRWFEHWVAYPIQNPGAKLSTAVVLWSAVQGVGKSMIGETIGKLYGAHFKTITAAELHGSFNGSWARETQFVLGEENASEDRRADAQKLKHLITGSTLMVNEKYQPQQIFENRMNFLFTSNCPDAFHVERYDRRFYIWEITAAAKSPAFYKEFVAWRDGKGIAALMHHLQNLDLSVFDPNAPAPMTAAKEEMKDASRTELERWLISLTEDGNAKWKLGREVTSSDDLVRIFNADHRKPVTSTAVGNALMRHIRPPTRRVVTRKGRKKLIALCNPTKWEAAKNDEWVEEYDRLVSLAPR